MSENHCNRQMYYKKLLPLLVALLVLIAQFLPAEPDILHLTLDTREAEPPILVPSAKDVPVVSSVDAKREGVDLPRGDAKGERASPEGLVVRHQNFVYRGSAWERESRTLRRYEVMSIIRKGQIQGVEKGDILDQVEFVY